MDHDKMLNINRIIRTTCATAPVCRIRLKISPPITAAKAGAGANTGAKAEANTGLQAEAKADAKLGANMDGICPPTMDANRGKCKFIIAKSTASIS
jgi:hypothetical protein